MNVNDNAVALRLQIKISIPIASLLCVFQGENETNRWIFFLSLIFLFWFLFCQLEL